MKHYLCLLLCIAVSSSFSQAIKGIARDSQNAPLPGANIYFDGTTIATIADEN